MFRGTTRTTISIEAELVHGNAAPSGSSAAFSRSAWCDARIVLYLQQWIASFNTILDGSSSMITVLTK
jgi:hypothetical protein